MKIQEECMPCIMKQIIEAAQMCTDNKQKIRNIINNFAQKVPDIDWNQTSPVVTETIHNMVKRELNNQDPYSFFKKKHIQLAKNCYQQTKELIEKENDTIKAALIMAATGNSIDSGIGLEINVEEAIIKGIKDGFTISNLLEFKKQLHSGIKLLIIADNSGEAYFDKLLIEELKKNYHIEITYAVRSVPILNDITMKEAREIGLDSICKLIKSGSRTAGMPLSEANEIFLKEMDTADIIISKGQGNFETLSENNLPLFYLLKAKCIPIAREFEVEPGSLIFKYYG